MKKIIKSIIVFFCSIIGLVIGILWFNQQKEWESILLIGISFLEIIGFLILKGMDEKSELPESKAADKSVNVSVKINNSPKSDNQKNESHNTASRAAIIASMKTRIRVVFIDDDKNFNVVKILKDSGWKNTKTIVDVKNLDIPAISESDVFFVDINGVGKLLNLEFEGLDLALMLKQKYPHKKVVIYSANKTSYSFHKAWDKCDFKLEKNALPYQFENLVEEFSLTLYNTVK